MANSQEAKGAYMLVYRKKKAADAPKQEVKMPEHCASVLRNLVEHHRKAKGDYNSQKDRKLRRAENKGKRMKGLWEELQVNFPRNLAQNQTRFFGAHTGFARRMFLTVCSLTLHSRLIITRV